MCSHVHLLAVWLSDCLAGRSKLEVVSGFRPGEGMEVDNAMPCHAMPGRSEAADEHTLAGLYYVCIKSTSTSTGLGDIWV
jgi:hypothetical protein